MKYMMLGILLVCVWCGSCRNGAGATAAERAAAGGVGGTGEASGDTVKKDDQLIMALLYQQRAAEYRALCLQSYNMARLRVDEAIKEGGEKPPAIVTDLDETALDNSANEAWLYLHDSAYAADEFDAWASFGKAGAVPGSVAFFNYVDALKDKKGRKVSIFYISNRTATEVIVDSTMSQMRRLGFPQVKASQCLFKGKDSVSSKEGRRQQVLVDHRIILLLGDNLIDLSAAFDHTAGDPERRLQLVDSLKDSWGKRYIVFPNAQYGDWEQALYPKGKYPASLRLEQEARVKELVPGHF